MDRAAAERLTNQALHVCGMKVATVRAFLEVLTGKLIQFDKRSSRSEMKRGGMPNIHRMGLLLQAKEKVAEDMKKAGVMDQDDESAMDTLRRSMSIHFTENFSPVKAVNKAIDAWLKSGKKPKYG